MNIEALAQSKFTSKKDMIDFFEKRGKSFPKYKIMFYS